MKALLLAALAVGGMSVVVAQVSPEDHAAQHSDQAAVGTAAAARNKAAPPAATPPPKTAPADAAVTDMQTRMDMMVGMMDQMMRHEEAQDAPH